MELLKNNENFGTGYKKGEDLDSFLEKLISFVERRIFNRISKRLNYVLKRVNDQRLEIIAEDNEDKNKDDNWRIIESDGDLLVQKRISGTWTTSEKYHG